MEGEREHDVISMPASHQMSLISSQ